MPDLRTPALLRQLLMYAQENPNASDSAQGIARWWLDPKDGLNLQALDEALDFLVSRGVFAERLAADGRRSYRRTCSDLHLQQLLAEAQSGCGGCANLPSSAGA
jgi:hypothetical protein